MSQNLKVSAGEANVSVSGSEGLGLVSVSGFNVSCPFLVIATSKISEFSSPEPWQIFPMSVILRKAPSKPKLHTKFEVTSFVHWAANVSYDELQRSVLSANCEADCRLKVTCLSS